MKLQNGFLLQYLQNLCFKYEKEHSSQIITKKFIIT